jgi:osmotically-inducible protein OsmY
MNGRQIHGIGIILLPMLLVLAGCRTNSSDLQSAGNQVDADAKRIGAEAQARAKPLVDQASQKTRVAAQQAKKSLDEAGVEMKVRTALGASSKIDTSDIHVSIVDGAVYLLGTVPKPDQVKLAGTIAGATVPSGTKVINELKAGAPPSAVPK